MRFKLWLVGGREKSTRQGLKAMETELFQNAEVLVIKAALFIQLSVFVAKMVWADIKKRKE